MLVPALIYITYNAKIMTKICKLFELLTNYKNCFNFRNVKFISEYKNKNHVFNFIFNAKS